MSAPLNQTGRDLVFCHGCENEWYRDEHGLECPECHSDVVEIIEAEHDPREEMHAPDLMNLMNPAAGYGPEAHSHPFSSIFQQGGFPGQRQPGAGQEGQGGGEPVVRHEEHETPDGTHIRRIVHFSSNLHGRQQRAAAGDGSRNPQQNVQDLFQSLFSQIGNMTPEQAVRSRQPGHAPSAGSSHQNPQSPSHPNASPFSTPSSPPYNRGPPPDPYTRGPPPAPDGQQQSGPQIRSQHYHWGPFSVQMTTSSNTTFNGQRVPPGGGGGIHPGMGPDEDMVGILSRAFSPTMPQMRPGPDRTVIFSTGNRGPGINAHEPGGGTFAGGVTGPLAMILSTLGLPVGAHGQLGDGVFSDEAMDRIVTRLMEQNQQGTAPGPATTEAINSLPRIQATREMMDEKTGTADCPICLVTVEVGEEVAQLPCKHWFHFECIQSWLGEHDTCPTCRRGITPREGDTNRPRETGEAPRHWQTASPSLSRSNTHEEPSDQEPSTGAYPESARPDSSHRDNPATANASRWRSRSPIRGGGDVNSTADSGNMAHSLRESVSTAVRNSLRNGIMGWMGRQRNDEHGSDNAQSGQAPGSGVDTSAGPSRETGHAQSRGADGNNAGNRAQNHNLDIPDVD